MFNQKTITNRRRRKSLGAQLADCASSRCGAGGNTTSLVGDIGLSLQRHGETIGTGGNTTSIAGGNGGASDAWPIGEVATWGLRKPALRNRR